MSHLTDSMSYATNICRPVMENGADMDISYELSPDTLRFTPADPVMTCSDSVATATAVTIVPDNWTDGIEGTSLQISTDGNSGILTVIVALFVILSLNFKECKKLFAHFTDELLNNKKRENAFDEHSNHESRLTILAVVQYLVYGGIILASIAVRRDEPVPAGDYSFNTLAAATGIFTAYYLFQICAYAITGYTFSGKDNSLRWLRAFNASQSLAGLGLIIPALMILFYPTAATAMSYVACGVYIIARLAFISKGFSIFYNNIFSLVYFILYLCALEIIPVIYVYKIAVLIL